MTLKRRLSIMARGYKTVRKQIPGYMLWRAINEMCHGLHPFINLFMSARIINALMERRPLNDLLWLAGITVAANLLTGVVRYLSWRISDYKGADSWRLINLPLSEKIQRMDYEHVEDATVHAKYNHIQTMLRTQGYGVIRLVWTFQELVRHTSTVVFSVALVIGAFTSVAAEPAGAWSFVFTPWFAAVMVGAILLGITLEVVRGLAETRKTGEIYAEFSHLSRVNSYYMEYLQNYKMGKDFRLYGMAPMMTAELDDFNKESIRISGRLWRYLAGYESLQVIMSTLMKALTYGYVGVKALFGAFPVGNIVQYIGAFTRFGSGVWELGRQFGFLWGNVEFMEKYYDFIDMPEKKHSGTLPVEKRANSDYNIEFHNVSFRYPGSDSYALKGLNLKLHAGQRLAVVGMNGSGKTTMIKLLCRLYDPTEGKITLNGIDIREYDYREYMNLFGAVFQDFKLFSFPLGQNVASSVDVHAQRAADSLRKAGVESGHLGLDTPLYKDFDENGVEISGGEAQKIAIARAIYKNTPFVVLDEPTAALDPIAEYEVYSQFNNIVEDKTAIFISHRLSSCRFCQDIAVFHEGELVQRGGHDQLLADEKGKYYEMWNAQAQYYQPASTPH